MGRKKAINVEIGRNIQEERMRAGYTQEELSELLDLTPNHLSAIERGVSGASIETLQKLCRVLGISADTILFGKDGEDDRVLNMAAQIARIPPECRRQIEKAMAAMLEMAEIVRQQKTVPEKEDGPESV